MGFFVLPFVSLSWVLIFVSGLEKFSYVLHFFLVLGLVLILLISICFDFNVS
jgi:hypothetical protein